MNPDFDLKGNEYITRQSHNFLHIWFNEYGECYEICISHKDILYCYADGKFEKGRTIFNNCPKSFPKPFKDALIYIY